MKLMTLFGIEELSTAAMARIRLSLNNAFVPKHMTIPQDLALGLSIYLRSNDRWQMGCQDESQAQHERASYLQ